MLSKLKHWFIPHSGNQFKPHAVRVRGYAVAFAVVLLSLVSFNVSNGQPAVLGYATNISPGALISLANGSRADAGLSGLSQNSLLTQAARNKANDMIAKDYWAHTSPSGKQPWDFVTEVGYNYTHTGENLGYGFSTSSGTHNGWMNSSGHRANILNSNYKDIGIAVVNGSNYQGGENTLVVAMYGARYSPPAPEPEPAPKPKPAPAPSTTATAPSEPASPAPSPEPEPDAAEEEPTTEEEAEPEQDDDSSAAGAAPVDQDPDTPAIESAPAGTSYSLFNPLSITTLSWAAGVGVVVSSALFMSSSLRHIHFWHKHRPHSFKHWLHKHPVFESLALGAITLVFLSSGFGVVG